MNQHLDRVSEIYKAYEDLGLEKESESITHATKRLLDVAVIPMLKLHADLQPPCATRAQVDSFMRYFLTGIEDQSGVYLNGRIILSQLMFDDCKASLARKVHGFDEPSKHSLGEELSEVIKAVHSCMLDVQYQAEDLLEDLNEEKPWWPFGYAASVHREYAKLITDMIGGIKQIVGQLEDMSGAALSRPLIWFDAWDKIAVAIAAYTGYSASFCAVQDKRKNNDT